MELRWTSSSDGEFVASEPGHRPAGGGLMAGLDQRLAEAMGDFQQQYVAGGMSKAVVDQLEALEIATARSRRSVSSRRFGSPVSGSCVASCIRLSGLTVLL